MLPRPWGSPTSPQVPTPARGWGFTNSSPSTWHPRISSSPPAWIDRSCLVQVHGKTHWKPGRKSPLVPFHVFSPLDHGATSLMSLQAPSPPREGFGTGALLCKTLKPVLRAELGLKALTGSFSRSCPRATASRMRRRQSITLRATTEVPHSQVLLIPTSLLSRGEALGSPRASKAGKARNPPGWIPHPSPSSLCCSRARVTFPGCPGPPSAAGPAQEPCPAPPEGHPPPQTA